MDLNSPLTSVGDRVRDARIEAKLSQDALAKKAHVAQSTIGNVESDPRRSLSGEVVFPIADALGVNARWLMTGCGPRFDKLAQRLADLEPKKLAAIMALLDIDS